VNFSGVFGLSKSNTLALMYSSLVIIAFDGDLNFAATHYFNVVEEISS
jgi:hypothetical protein